MQRFPLSSLILCAIALTSLPGVAGGELVIAESIDWVATDADRVVAGKIVKVEKVRKDEKDEKEKEHEVATVDVTRTLKGEHTDKVTFLLRNYNGPIAKDWMADGVPMLFFLVKSERAKDRASLPVKFDWTLRDDGNKHCAVLLGKTERYWTFTIPVLTREFDIPTEPDAILKRVQKAIGSIPKDRNPRPRAPGARRYCCM